jgi:hypothetical protein
MKRLTAALLSLAAIVMLALPAQAVKLASEPLKFRTHKATAASGEILKDDFLTWGTTCLACAVDSSTFFRLNTAGTTHGIAQWDTTVAISTEGWSIPQTSGVADSAVVARLIVYAGSADHGVSDSVYVGIQVSPDGRVWNYVNPIKDVIGTNPVTAVAAAVAGFGVTESGGDGDVYSLVFRKGGEVSGSLPDRYNFWQWPYLRFVISGDHTATVSALSAKIVYWVE